MSGAAIIAGSARFTGGGVVLYRGGREVAQLDRYEDTAALRAALREHFGAGATLTGHWPLARVEMPMPTPGTIAEAVSAYADGVAA